VNTLVASISGPLGSSPSRAPKAPRYRYPWAPFTYGYSLTVVAATAFVIASWPTVSVQNSAGVTFCVLLSLPVAIVIQLFWLPDRWRCHGSRDLLPLLTCLVAVPLGVLGGAARHRMIPAWFSLNRDRYEAAAASARAGTYSASDMEAFLGFGARTIRSNDDVIAVHFTVAKAGRACTEYLRLYDEQHLQLGSPGGRSLGAGWYLMATSCDPQSATGWTEIRDTWLVARR